MIVADIVRLCGGPRNFAKELGIGASGVSQMQKRGSIPVRYWSTILRIIRMRGYSSFTSDDLLEITARGKDS